MKIVSWNVNGLRSVFNKGVLIDWFTREKPDIACFQEIKVQKDQLPKELVKLPGYHSYFNCAQKKGYSGVLIYSKEKPISSKKNFGSKRFDSEGRILELKYENFTLINLYIPHGGREKENLGYKLEVYKNLLSKLESYRRKKIILMGDFNIAHKEIDLERPKNNKNNIMFTSEERKQIDKIVDLGFVDTFRIFNKKSGNYTWWSYMQSAREKNIGWRIDYCFVSKSLSGKVKKAFIQPNVFGSDHCPIGVEIT